MDLPLDSTSRLWICAGLLLFGVVFCVAHIVRSIKLKKGFSESTIKMYISFMAFTVLGIVALSGVVKGEAVAAIIGGAIGYALGNKKDDGTNDE